MVIQVGIYTGLWIAIATIMYLDHVPESAPLMCVILITLVVGVIMGTLQEKWQRDKQMSKIVAERLLRKPEIASDPQMNTGGLAQAQANMNAQMNTYLSSLLGSTTTSQGGVSKAIGKIT